MEHEQAEKSCGMFKCKCGFTCGVLSALDRHITKATNAPLQSEWEEHLTNRRASRASTACDGALSRTWPSMKNSTSEPVLQKSILHTRSENLLYSSGGRQMECSKEGALLPVAKHQTDKGSSKVGLSSSGKRTSFGMSIEIPVDNLTDEQPSGMHRSSSSGSVSGSSLSTPMSVLESPRTPARGVLPPLWLCQHDAKSNQLSGSSTPIRLLLVRHAQSANRDRLSGEQASPDPELSDRGFQQADALGKRLEYQFRPFRGQWNSLLVVSSPMKRCILTIRPAVQKFQLWLSPGLILCHGSCYEYGCAGKRFGGTPARDISKDFPEFKPVGFGKGGYWDYCGDNPKETETECRARGARIKEWLQGEAAAALLSQSNGHKSSGTPTILLCIHQTIADLLCHLFVEGSGDGWKYGDIKYKLSNTGMTEIFLHPDGQALFGDLNDDKHALGLPQVKSRRASAFV